MKKSRRNSIQKRHFIKLPTELEEYIFELSGALTQYLNNQNSATSRTKECVERMLQKVRRDVIHQEWRGTEDGRNSCMAVTSLFKEPASKLYRFKCVLDTVSQPKTKQYHDFLMGQLEGDKKTQWLIRELSKIELKVWWRLKISCEQWMEPVLKLFHSAIVYGRLDLLEYLLTDVRCRQFIDTRGIDIGSSSYTSLGLSAFSGLNTFKLLQQHGATQFDFPKTLMNASYHGHSSLVSHLCRTQSDMAAVEEACVLAAKMGHYEIVRYLYETQLYPRLKQQGDTENILDEVVEAARESGRKSLITYLECRVI